MLTRADKPFIDLVEKYNHRPIPLYSVALNANKLFAHLWVVGFVINNLSFKLHRLFNPVDAVLYTLVIITQVGAAITLCLGVYLQKDFKP